MEVELELSRGCRISGDRSDPPVGLAATELETTIGIGGEDALEIVLSHDGGAGEGFRRNAEPRRLALHGESARGVLFGAYATLEELGAHSRWPGETGHVGARAALEADLETAPALSGRCLVLGDRSLVEDAESWIIWASRNRLNSLFVHVSTGAEPVGAAPEAAWRDRRDRAVDLARERGMTIEHGGHLIPELLSAKQIGALTEGRRSSEVRRILEEHVHAHPEVDVFHLWGADVPAEGGRERSEAELRAANAIAEVVEDSRPGAEVAYLAYHDTLAVPTGVRRHRNVSLVFAPRERCYDHALSDPGCRRNARHRELLLAQVEHFAAVGGAPARVFEYWFDAILFSGGIPDLTETMARDLGFYREAGVHTVQMLMTGHGPPPAPHPNVAAFPRLAWDPERPPGLR